MIWYEKYIKDDLFRPQLDTVKKKKISDNIICFDIETCNYFVLNDTVYSINEIIQLCNHDIKRIEKFFDEAEAGAVPYIWQFCIDGTCVYGREITDSIKLLKYINKKVAGYECHVWIHNISFEYTFLQEHLKIRKENIFFTEARKPLYFKWKNLYFRCSYRLTNISLAKWGSNLGIPKKTGDLDYYELYTPKTELSEKNLGYCEYDVIIMYFGIKKYLEQYKHICYIPLTQTGIVRKDIKAENQKVRGWCGKVAKMQPRTPEEWKIQNRTYCGGLTLSNPRNTGVVLHNMGSIDKKSAYPFAMLDKYPCTAFEKSPAAPIWEDGNHHICLVEFHNLRARYDITPLSASKRIMMHGAVLGGVDPDSDTGSLSKNNGKVIYAAVFCQYITEVDKRLIDMYYTYDTYPNPTIHSHYIALSDYMPPHVIRYMLNRYEQKTLLSGVDEEMRMIEKQKLNSIYGMCGTALVHDTIEENEQFKYLKMRLNDSQILTELQKYKTNKYKNVLPYSWGIYITAYQRYYLMEMAHKFDLNKIAYFDTDSIKGFFNAQDELIIAAENERIKQWTRERLELQDIPYEMSCPKNTDGVREYLGIWEHDALYENIKFMGAKRYAYQTRDKKGELSKVKITIAGVPKAAADVLKSVDDLKEGLYFDIFNSRKNLLTYRDGDNPRVTFPDGYTVKQKCACNIRPTSYKLTLTSDYRDLIKKYLAQKYH
jgi:hypothetical protein